MRGKECMEAKALKSNIRKTKVMISGKNYTDIERTGKWACVDCGKDVNSVKCIWCRRWVYKRERFILVHGFGLWISSQHTVKHGSGKW